jgi:hypothetical protein
MLENLIIMLKNVMIQENAEMMIDVIMIDLILDNVIMIDLILDNAIMIDAILDNVIMIDAILDNVIMIDAILEIVIIIDAVTLENATEIILKLLLHSMLLQVCL